ncbi:ST8SIA1 [Branchiostoma lanceolatum]|uniref:ST8SIA1 protein n=2 Tax=Branchiostoma lanceolatum TaxID=7740 RepID=A0A8K0ECR0_BRALA|nr:ST8SIA1 [Branchiostoma lanceolatum]
MQQQLNNTERLSSIMQLRSRRCVLVLGVSIVCNVVLFLRVMQPRETHVTEFIRKEGEFQELRAAALQEPSRLTDDESHDVLRPDEPAFRSRDFQRTEKEEAIPKSDDEEDPETDDKDSEDNKQEDEKVVKPVAKENVFHESGIKDNGTAPATTSPPPEAVPTDNPNWVFNVTAADEFRTLVEEATKTQDIFVMTQRNVQLNRLLKYEAQKYYINVTRDLYNWLPRDPPFGFKKYKKCSVVGNGGILLKSGCGEKIDSADFVIRLNLPYMGNYSRDVGKKTNLVTANPTILKERFRSLRFRVNRDTFLNYTSHFQDAFMYFSAFTYRMCTTLSFNAYRTVQSVKGKRTNATVIFGHPQHLALATKFWKGQYKINERRLTSGLYLAGTALSLCEETHLYGFWPFDHDRQGRVLTHHYYDNVTMSAKHKRIRQHSIPEEFAVLRSLHNRGVLHMTTDRCS